MKTRILVVDDLLDVLDDTDNLYDRLEMTMRIVAHKSGHSLAPAQANGISIRADLEACGEYTIDTATTAEDAIELLGESLSGMTPRYDVVLLDGGFDKVLDYIADMNRMFDTCPMYVKPISSSAQRNLDMSRKISVLTTTKLLDNTVAKQLGLSRIVRGS